MRMRKMVSDFYRKSEWGYYTFKVFYDIYILSLRLVPDEVVIKNSFKRHMGYPLDLKNPQTLNEKLNWLKLYDRKELYTTIADKYAVRHYVTQKIGDKYLIPLFFETKNAKDLTPDNLPDNNFIIKTNHDSSGGLIVRDSSEVDWKKTQEKFSRLLKEDHYIVTREWQYKNIPRRIIVEQLLTTKEDKIPNDYKFLFLNGKLAFIIVDIDRFEANRTRNLYDSKWNLLPFEWKRPKGPHIEKPKNFKKMKKLAKKLARDFVCLRVDMYNIDGNIYIGELTLHHSSGLSKFVQEEYDFKLGKLLNIENLQLSRK
ncbi:MAG: glycosyl transferase [Winogradskyella sp.]|nr:glycosyl transferase [Winogradskyella sp.]